jgi:hypothetical protein
MRDLCPFFIRFKSDECGLNENQAFGSRDSSRVQTTLQARIGPECTLGERTSHATIYNISRSGAFFSLDNGHLPEVGERVNFTFHDPSSGAPPVYGKGECRWIGRDARTDQYGFGLKFREINPQSFESFFVHMTRLGSIPKIVSDSQKQEPVLFNS